MIRINLNGEKKGTPAKAKRKKRENASGLEQNLILLIGAVIGIAMFFGIGWNIKKENARVTKIHNAKKAEYDKLAKWDKIKLEYDIQKELMTEKIRKIGQLKERREGPVKLLEDVFNNLPKSVWLVSITQGYDKRLVSKIAKGMTVLKPGKNIGAPNQLLIIGRSRTQDAASSFANRMEGIETRYKSVTLNTIVEIKDKSSIHSFEFKLFLKMVPGYEKILKAEADKKKSGGRK